MIILYVIFTYLFLFLQTAFAGDTFIVVLKHNVNFTNANMSAMFLDAHLSYLQMFYSEVVIYSTYKNLLVFDWIGYEAYLTDDAYKAVKNDPRVMFLEDAFPKANFGLMKAASAFQNNMVTYVPYDPTSLGRLTTNDKVFEISNGICTYEYDLYDQYVSAKDDEAVFGEGIDVYVLDTGIQRSHSVFEGRAMWGFDAINSSHAVKDDPHGHGTYVAGIIGGVKYGLARGVTLIDVRVLDETGHGTVKDIIAGLDYVAGQVKDSLVKNGFSSSVINLSVSGKGSLALNSALNAVAEGVVIIVAAGDDDVYSCDASPSSARNVLAVAATSRSSQLQVMNSNFGDCIAINAPGEDIPSALADPLSKYGSVSRSGSSSASAIVSGLAAISIAEVIGSTSVRQIDLPVPRLMRAVLRKATDRDPDSPHALPWEPCQAASRLEVVSLVRGLIREQVSRKFAAATLSSVRKNVKAAVSKQSEEPELPEKSDSERVWRSRQLEATEDADEAKPDGAEPRESTTAAEVKVPQTQTRKGKTQAEIIADARKLRKLKKK